MIVRLLEPAVAVKRPAAHAPALSAPTGGRPG